MTKAYPDYSTIVIGASLSGSITAFRLASEGKRVLLIDSQPFPRQKACGEGLSVLGKSYLKSMGLWNGTLARASHPFFGYIIEFENGKQAILKSKSHQGYTISRVLLDATINRAAVSLPTVTLCKERVIAIDRTSGGWMVRSSNGKSFVTSNLVMACGSGVSKLLPNVEEKRSGGRRFAIAFWCEGKWENEMPSEVLIRHRAEGEYLITPLTGGRVNATVLLKSGFGAEIKKADVIKQVALFLEAYGFQLEGISDSKGVNSIEHVTRATHEPGVFLVGDAAERLDPIGGMGMTHAIFSAFQAAEAILVAQKRYAHEQYKRKLELGAVVLRTLTALSYSLNVSRHPLLTGLVKGAPGAALFMMGLVRNLFPGISSEASFLRLNQAVSSLSSISDIQKSASIAQES